MSTTPTCNVNNHQIIKIFFECEKMNLIVVKIEIYEIKTQNIDASPSHLRHGFTSSNTLQPDQTSLRHRRVAQFFLEHRGHTAQWNGFCRCVQSKVSDRIQE